MKTKTVRILVPLAVAAVIAVGFALNTGVGSLSAIGWHDISLLCPLGALTTMLASKALVPRALVSLGIGLVLMVVFGRLFCGWVCPVPVVNKLPQLFKKKEARPTADAEEPHARRQHGCAACREHAVEMFDSRHLVLGGTLLSAVIFGFPVFCLICPIGLTFATIFLVIALFTGGDITWSLVVVPVVLLLEVTVFKKWCSKICPLGAMMSIMARLNKRVLQPTVDEGKCLEGDCVQCGRCNAVCEVGIDPRHPERGASLSECTKCRACVEACPAQAVSLPLLAKGVEPTER